MVKMSIKEMKFDDITVTLQPAKPRYPTMERPAARQQKRGRTIQRKLLNITPIVTVRKRKTPAPKKAKPAAKKGKWGKPSKEKVGKVLKGLKDNPIPDSGVPDDGGATRSELSAMRTKNQSGSTNKAQAIIKRRRA